MTDLSSNNGFPADKIILSGMAFHSYHGVLEAEQLLGNNFVVDLEATLDLSAAAASDCLEDTVNYADIYGIVAREMAIPSRLLENVAGRIASGVKSAFPAVVMVKVTVSKQNPPVLGVFPAGGEVAAAPASPAGPGSPAPCAWSRVELTR